MKQLLRFKTFLLMAVLSLLAGTSAWAESDPFYTLDTTTEAARTTSNNYAGTGTVTLNGIEWTVNGNGQMFPWRLGGKSISNTDRTVNTNTAMGSAINKVVLTVGTAKNITVNSLKLTVASDANFSNVLDEVTATFAASSDITFEPSTGTEWTTGAYYKFTFNVTVSGSSNKFVQFSGVKFYAPEGTSSNPSISADNVDIEYNATAGEIIYSVNNPATGGFLSASTTASWLTVGTVGETVPFTCDTNDGIERTATVTLTYTYGSESVSKNVLVTQAGNPNAPGTENNPYTVAEARAAIDAGTGVTDVYAKGIVSEIVTAYNSKYGNITYNISADGTTTADQLQAFRGKSYNGESFTSEDDIQVGDEVVVYGNLKKYGETYEFDTNNQLVSLQRPVVTTPSITIDPATYTMDAKAGGGEIPVVSENLASDPQLAVVFVEADGVIPATYDWISATINADGNIVGAIQANTGDARTAYFYVTGKDANGNTVQSNLVTFTQEAPVAATPTIVFNPESIDFDANGGSKTIGGDYFQLKDFDSTPSLEILYYESDGEISAAYDWITASFNADGKIDLDYNDNTGAARTAYLKIHAVGTTVYSNLFTVNQAAYVAPALTQINLTKTLVFDTDCGLASGGYAVNDELTELSGTFEGDASATRFGGFVIKDSYINGSSIQMKKESGSITFPTIVSEYGFDVNVVYQTNEAKVYINGVESTEASAGNTSLMIATGDKYCQITSITLTPKTSEVPPTVDVKEPVITAADGLVEIIQGADNVQVIYTTDGTEPTYNPLNGTVYTEPFNITVDTTIKAIGVDADGNASDVVEVAVTAPVVSGVKYYKVTSTDQLEEGVDYLLVYEGEAGEGAAAYGGLNSYTGYSIGKSVALKHIGGSVVTITDEEVVPVTLKSRSEDGTKWAMRDATGWIAAVNGYNNLHGDKTEDDAIWTFDFTADANKQIFQEFTATSTRYLQYNTSSPRFAGYTGTQSAVYLYKAATYNVSVNVSVGATGYATLYYGTKNLVVPEDVEAYTYTVNNGKLEESYLYSTNEVIPAGTGVVLKAPAGEYKFAVTTEAGLEDTDNLLFGFDEPSTTVAPAAGDYLFYLLGVDNGKVGFYWGKAEGAAFTSGAHKAYLAVPTEQASGLRGFSFDGSVVGINTIGIDMPEGNAYDLQGRRVQQLQKNGLYIVGGKKVLAK